MARDRKELQKIFESIMYDPKTKRANVYYQPPPSVKMSYPCIVYADNSVRVAYADNTPYLRNKSYSVTLIDRCSDSKYNESLSNLPYSEFETSFAKDGLNHYRYTIYF